MADRTAIVLGLDGATFDVIAPWAAAGGLPNLAALMSRGATGPLRSTLPYVTPVAWPSIYTGSNPGRHGILGFAHRAGNSYRWVPYSIADMKTPAMWDALAEEGGRSALLFLPFNHPLRPLAGVAVSGAFGARGPAHDACYPDSLGAQLARTADPVIWERRQLPGMPLAQVADRIVRAVDAQTAAMVEVLNTRGPFDLVFAAWHDTDRAAHLFWHHSDLPCPDLGSPMHRIYEAVDRGIGRVLETLGGDPLVMLCSDHGTYPIVDRIATHAWLEQQGLLTRSRSRGMSAMKLARELWLRSPNPIKRLLPANLRAKGARTVHERTVKQGPPIDWAATRLFPQTGSPEAFFANVRGREPNGTVEPDELDALFVDFADRLTGLTGAGDRRLVEKAHRSSDIYEGPMVRWAPDVVVETTKGAMFAPTSWGGDRIVTSPERPDLEHGEPRSIAYHQIDGIALIAGPGVRGGVSLEASVCDVAPTILRYLDVPIPDTVDGAAITRAFSDLPAERPARSIRSAPARALDPEEEAAVEQQLRDLGYIE